MFKIQVRETQRSIKHALTERYYAWQEAVDIARKDERYNMTAEGPILSNEEVLEEEEGDADKLVDEHADKKVEEKTA